MVERVQYCFEDDGMLPLRKNVSEHETQSSAPTFFLVLETILECFKTVLSTLYHYLLRLDNSRKRYFSHFEHVTQPIRLRESYCLIRL